MKGIKYMRGILGITADDFSKQMGVTPSLVSKWDSGKNSIPKKRLEQISETYGIPKELISREVDNSDKEAIRRSVLGEEPIPQEVLDQWSEQDEIEENKRIADLNSFTKNLYDAQRYNPKMYTLIKQVYEICNMSYGEAVINLLLTAVRQYYGISSAGEYILIGDTDYKSGRYKKDDSALNIIASLLQLAIPREKTMQEDKENE